MKRRVGLSAEILVTLFFLLGAALILGGLLVLRLVESSLIDERVRHLNNVSSYVAKIIQVSEDDDSPQMKIDYRIMRTLNRDDDCEGIWLLDNNLQLVESLGGAERLEVDALQARRVILNKASSQKVVYSSILDYGGETDSWAEWYVPIVHRQQTIGVMVFHYSLDRIRSQLIFNVRLVMAYAALYVIVLIIAGYLILKRNVIEPVKKLMTVSNDITNGNLDVNVSEEGPAEIYQLAQSFNIMIMALQQANSDADHYIKSLKLANSHLEDTRNDLVRSEKLATIGQLSAGLAHEVGNPLAAIIGYLALLESQVSSPETRDIVIRSQKEAERINFLVKELLDFARPATSSKQVVNPVDVLEGTVELLSHQGIFKKIQLLKDLRSSSVVFIDPQKLQQVFINLFLNAVYACKNSGSIKMNSVCRDSLISIDIEDDGCGISDANIKHLFDPFFTTKADGRGLGLAVSQRIIEDANGRIDVRSQVGHGTVFSIRLPLYHEKNADGLCN